MMKEVTVHNKEWDIDFIRAFRRFLESNFGAEFGEVTQIGPAGSQEFICIPFRIGKDDLLLLSETYMGVTLKGPEKLVDKIVARKNETGGLS